MFELRPYQSLAVDKIRDRLRAGLRRVLLYCPTGGGKTEIAMHIIQSAQDKGKRVAFVCNRINLISQASRRFADAGIEHGIIQGANTCRSYFPVLVCSIDTIAVRGLPEMDLVIVDECHACSGTKAYVDLFLSHKVPAIGLTATPFTRGLGRQVKDLGPLFEGIVVAATIQELILQKYLVDCDIYSPGSGDLDLSRVKTVAGEYHAGQLSAELERTQRTRIGDIVSHWKDLAGGKSTVCFAFDIADSKAIAQRFLCSGISAEHLDCYTKDDERSEILARVESGETKVVSNCAVLAEGWDCPRTEVMINAAPTKSLTRWIQKAGRILRPYDGKAKALILDHSETAENLGYPTDDLQLQLDGGKPRKSSPEKEGPAKAAKCPKCAFVRPAGIHACPLCGFAPERQANVVTISGKLQKLARRNPSAEDKAQVFSELKWIAMDRGYSPGWASHKYRERFGVWPRGVDGPAVEPSLEIRKWVTSRQIAWAKTRKRLST